MTAGPPRRAARPRRARAGRVRPSPRPAAGDDALRGEVRQQQPLRGTASAVDARCELVHPREPARARGRFQARRAEELRSERQRDVGVRIGLRGQGALEEVDHLRPRAPDRQGQAEQEDGAPVRLGVAGGAERGARSPRRADSAIRSSASASSRSASARSRSAGGSVTARRR